MELVTSSVKSPTQLRDSKASILLVDDNSANLLSLRALLEDLGHELVEARSGEEAIGRMQCKEFAIVLLDVTMPGLSGFETAKRIRSNGHATDIPIIFVTANEVDSPEFEEGYSLGAVDFLIKPKRTTRQPKRRADWVSG